jgi:hypothetical protein
MTDDRQQTTDRGETPLPQLKHGAWGVIECFHDFYGFYHFYGFYEWSFL